MSVEEPNLPQAAAAAKDAAKYEKMISMSKQEFGEDHPATKGLRDQLDRAKAKSNGHAQLKNDKQVSDARLSLSSHRAKLLEDQ
eukprot:9710324-Karenia_brevis.AAC.1